MVEIVVAGADFSGAKNEPNETWLTVAKVGPLGIEVLDMKRYTDTVCPAPAQSPLHRANPSIQAFPRLAIAKKFERLCMDVLLEGWIYHLNPPG